MSDIIQDRYQKLNLLVNKGIDPFGGKFSVSAHVKELVAGFKAGDKAAIAGRIMAKRKHGKSIFADLRDETEKMQLYFNNDILGPEKFEIADSMLDIGDIIGATGELFKTRTGEPKIGR